MVAPVSVGKAATTATQSVGKLASKSEGATARPDSQNFEQMLGDPSKAGSTAGPGQTEGAAAAAGNAAGAATPAAQASEGQANVAATGGPGDKILSGIDKVRGEASELMQRVGGMSGADGAGGSEVSDMLSMQASLVSFEVTTQAGGKGIQETSTAVQTLLKGQ